MGLRHGVRRIGAARLARRGSARRDARRSLSPERVDACLAVGLAWFQDDGWEIGLVDRIRKVLSFEADSAALLVDLASLPLLPLHEVPGIDLHAWLSGVDGHGPA